MTVHDDQNMPINIDISYNVFLVSGFVKGSAKKMRGQNKVIKKTCFCFTVN